MLKCPLCKRSILLPAWKLCDDCMDRRKKEARIKKQNEKRKMLLLSQNNMVVPLPSTPSQNTI